MAEPSDYLFLPPSAIKVADREFTRRINNRSALGWGIPEIDNRMTPLIPGDLMGLIARPNVGKTYDMMMLARHHAQTLAIQHPDKPPLVIYATWETMVEEFVGVMAGEFTGHTLSEVARGTADINNMRRGLMHLMGKNFVVFGVSITKIIDGIRLPPPTILDLILGIKELQDMGYDVAICYIDYLQRVPDIKRQVGGSPDDTRGRVTSNLEMIKSDLTLGLGLPGVVGVQARREVDKYPGIKLPLLDDGMWTSSIEHTCDKIFTETRPGMYSLTPVGSEFVVNGMVYEVTPTTKVIAMVKQRFASANSQDVWVLQFDPLKITVRIQQPIRVDTGDDDDPTGMGNVI